MVEVSPKELQSIESVLGGATPVFAAHVKKMNEVGTWQKRYIVVTASHFYNVKNGFLGYSVQRELGLDYLQGVVLRPASCEFLVKISQQNCGDHWYQADCGKRLARSLVRLRGYIKVWTVETDLLQYRKFKRRQPQADIELFETARFPQ